MMADIQDEQRRLAASVIAKGGMENWLSEHAADVERYDRFMADIKAGEAPDVAKLMVALRHVRGLG